VNLCVIPARGGSKRIPRKNLRDFCGRPIIAYSIETALESGCFDRVVVSTDDPDISARARSLGADVPFVRPPEISDDHTGTNAVVAHAVTWLQKQGKSFDNVACICATAPFLEGDTVRRGLDLLCASGADFVVSITSFPYPVQRALRLDPDNRVEMFEPRFRMTRSQDLEEAFHDAGQLYWGTVKAFTGEVPMFESSTVGLRVPRFRVQDIDSPEDWHRAELLFRALQQEAGE